MKNIIAFVCLFVAVLSQTIGCTYNDNSYGVNYDLTSLIKQDGSYTYLDAVQDGSRNRTFVFNICKNVEPIPRDSAGGKNCEETQHSKEGTTKDPSPFYFVSQSDSTCSRAGGDVTLAENYVWNLLDSSNPAGGVTLTYKNGDYCPNSYLQNYHTTYFYFECRETSKSLEETVIVEPYPYYCFDRVWISTPNACPSTCPHTSTSICSSHGMCGYDVNIKSARCFCNSGYGGDDCSSKVFVGLSASTIFYILNGCILLVVICTVVYMWNKLHKLRVDPEADVSLEATFNQLGQYAM